MSEPREIVAQTMWSYGAEDDPEVDPYYCEWAEASEDGRRYYLKQADAIIAALGAGGVAVVPKEPTDEMVIAGGQAYLDRANILVVYRAMIESALEENANG